jgi:Zn finger protein HypA/HybF involved in hydrogenase expression
VVYSSGTSNPERGRDVAATAYCNSCERTVYIEVDQEMFCPVCATPVAEVAEAEADHTEVPVA